VSAEITVVFHPQRVPDRPLPATTLAEIDRRSRWPPRALRRTESIVLAPAARRRLRPRLVPGTTTKCQLPQGDRPRALPRMWVAVKAAPYFPARSCRGLLLPHRPLRGDIPLRSTAIASGKPWRQNFEW